MVAPQGQAIADARRQNHGNRITPNILTIDAIPRRSRSLGRALTQTFVEAFMAQAEANSLRRDLARTGLGLFDEEWIAAAFKPAADRSAEQHGSISACG